MLDYIFKNEEMNHYWLEYLFYYDKKLKKESSKYLQRFIKLFEKEEFDIRREFVFFLCKTKYDEKGKFIIQYPILKDVIYPILKIGYIENNMPETRWLYQTKLREKIIQLTSKNDYAEDMLMKCLKIAPDDYLSSELLLEYYIDILEYGSHELPETLSLDGEYCKRILKKITSIPLSNNIDQKIRNRYEYEVKLYSDWFDYTSGNNEVSFRKWCEKYGKKYIW